MVSVSLCYQDLFVADLFTSWDLFLHSLLLFVPKDQDFPFLNAINEIIINFTRKT